MNKPNGADELGKRQRKKKKARVASPEPDAASQSNSNTQQSTATVCLKTLVQAASHSCWWPHDSEWLSRHKLSVHFTSHQGHLSLAVSRLLQPRLFCIDAVDHSVSVSVCNMLLRSDAAAALHFDACLLHNIGGIYFCQTEARGLRLAVTMLLSTKSYVFKAEK